MPTYRHRRGCALAETESKFGIDLNGTEREYGYSETQLAVVEDLGSAVQSRDKEILQIAKSIEELSSIFQELVVLVIDQVTILNRIDYNMEAVVEHTKVLINQERQKDIRRMRGL